MGAALCQPYEICLLFGFLMPLTRRLFCLIGRGALEPKLHCVYALLLIAKTEDVIFFTTAEGLTCCTYPNWQSVRPPSSYTSQMSVSLEIQSKTQGNTVYIHWVTVLNRQYFKSAHSEYLWIVHASFGKDRKKR